MAQQSTYTHSNALRLRLNGYAAVSFLLLLLCGALALGFPLYKQNEQAARHLLTAAVINRAQSIDTWLRHTQAVVWRTTQRPDIQNLLRNTHSLDSGEAQRMLAASMGITGDTAALRLLDARGTPLAHCGKDIPAALIPQHITQIKEIYTAPPTVSGQDTYMLLAAPVYTKLSVDQQNMSPTDDVALGYILLLRNMRYLQEMLENNPDKELPAAYSLSLGSGRYFGQKPSPAAQQALQKASTGQSGTYIDTASAYAYAPVHWRQWGLVATVPLEALYASATSGFVLLLLSTLGIYALCLLGFYLLSRPLAGRILMHTQELERDIAQHRATQNSLQKAHSLLQQAYAKHQDLSGQILTMHEQTRQSLAKDLHDNIGQQLATLHVHLEILRTRLHAYLTQHDAPVPVNTTPQDHAGINIHSPQPVPLAEQSSQTEEQTLLAPATSHTTAAISDAASITAEPGMMRGASEPVQRVKAPPAINGADIERAVNDAAYAVQHIQKDLRHTAHGLYPPALELQGLADSIEHLCHDVQNALTVHYSIGTLPPVPAEQALCIYRIAQEALHNCIRHAKATQVHLSLHVHDDAICLTVEDNGCGFNSGDSDAGTGRHMGLRLMRERAQFCGGTLTIDSTPQRGTLIFVNVPLQHSFEQGVPSVQPSNMTDDVYSAQIQPYAASNDAPSQTSQEQLRCTHGQQEATATCPASDNHCSVKEHS